MGPTSVRQYPAMPEPVSRTARLALAVLFLAPLWLLCLVPIVLAALGEAIAQWWAINPVRKLRAWERSRFLVQDRDAE